MIPGISKKFKGKLVLKYCLYFKYVKGAFIFLFLLKLDSKSTLRNTKIRKKLAEYTICAKRPILFLELGMLHL